MSAEALTAAEQKSLLEETIDEDLEALSREIEREQPIQSAAAPKKQPKRQPLPAHLPRREIRHEPQATVCSCGCALKRIGEDVAEKLDYTPGIFAVERHIRGKWVCAKCETLVQALVAAHIIDKGLPTASLLAQVLVAKYAASSVIAHCANACAVTAHSVVRRSHPSALVDSACACA